MCGISGILNFKNAEVARDDLQKMTKCLVHRGPDAEGFFFDKEIGLSHNRLSILDLSSSANQPMIDSSGRYVIVYNGEIYNFKSIKQQLSDYTFLTTGDTEVVLAAFIKFGPDCVSHFEGMFAFAIWDKEERQLTIVRDRFGVKPLYYYHDNERLLFSSEVRSLLATGWIDRKISRKGLLEYFSYQSIGYPYTLIQNVFQLKAGSWLTIKNEVIKTKEYWNPYYNEVSFNFGDVSLVKKNIKKLLVESVEKRLVSDVPVGAFLSGGIDSSAVVGLMSEVANSRLHTFNVSFGEETFDESEYATLVSKKFNTAHTNIRLNSHVFIDELEDALGAMDTPTGDGINTYVISRAVRNAGIKVALSGIGGDELFAGYPIFSQFLKLTNQKSLYNKTDILRKVIASLLPVNASGKIQRIKQIIEVGNPSIQNLYPILRQVLSTGLIRQLTNLVIENPTALSAELERIGPSLKKLPLLSQVSVAEYLGYTQSTLLKDADQMSMSVGLEVREPFFDHKLVEFILAIPDEIKKPTYPKSLLVDSLKPLLPDEISNRKKQGFLFPWNVWMRGELRPFCELQINNISQRDFVNGDQLKKYWRRFLKNDSGVRWSELWLFIVLEYWLEKNNVN